MRGIERLFFAARSVSVSPSVSAFKMPIPIAIPIPMICGFTSNGIWRRGGDSNPRAAYATRRFRGAPVTTTSVPLRTGSQNIDCSPKPGFRPNPRAYRRAWKKSWITARQSSARMPPTRSASPSMNSSAAGPGCISLPSRRRSSAFRRTSLARLPWCAAAPSDGAAPSSLTSQTRFMPGYWSPSSPDCAAWPAWPPVVSYSAPARPSTRSAGLACP